MWRDNVLIIDNRYYTKVDKLYDDAVLAGFTLDAGPRSFDSRADICFTFNVDSGEWRIIPRTPAALLWLQLNVPG